MLDLLIEKIGVGPNKKQAFIKSAELDSKEYAADDVVQIIGYRGVTVASKAVGATKLTILAQVN